VKKKTYPPPGSGMSFRIIEPNLITGDQSTDFEPSLTVATHIYNYHKFNEVWKKICDAADEHCRRRKNVGYFYIFPAAGTWYVRYSTEELEMGRPGRHPGHEDRNIPALGDEEWKVEQFMEEMEKNETTYCTVQ
jgi:hypothetical protein